MFQRPLSLLVILLTALSQTCFASEHEKDPTEVKLKTTKSTESRVGVDKPKLQTPVQKETETKKSVTLTQGTTVDQSQKVSTEKQVTVEKKAPVVLTQEKKEDASKAKQKETSLHKQDKVLLTQEPKKEDKEPAKNEKAVVLTKEQNKKESEPAKKEEKIILTQEAPLEDVKPSRTSKKEMRRSHKKWFNAKLLTKFVSTAPIKNHQSNKALFFQTNIGVGMLYFKDISGNLMGAPATDFLASNSWRDAPLKGRLSYNRTPLFDYILGYKFNAGFKVALSYQSQGGVTVQSPAIYSAPPAANATTDYIFFRSKLSLNGIFFKLYFESPHVINAKRMTIIPYLGVGVGPAWQSWNKIQLLYHRGHTFLIGDKISVNDKTSANVGFLADAGLRLQQGSFSPNFSVFLGCKYNHWGQARSMGKMSQQPYHKVALFKPVKIKSVYQFAPYLGLQWNYPNDCGCGTNASTPSIRWKPLFKYYGGFHCNKVLFTQFNVGVGMLYFAGAKGNLFGIPAVNFFGPGQTDSRDIPFRGALSYNRAPLLDYILGYRITPWFKVALSYQYQAGMTVQTRYLWDMITAGNNSYMGKLAANVMLNGIFAKVYFNLPYAMIVRSLAFTPYLAAGVGPAWQSWTTIEMIHNRIAAGFISCQALPLRQKISANAALVADAGVRIQNAFKSPSLSVMTGCKFNLWGQARSMGKLTQQGIQKQAVSQPLKVRSIYQFAPYLGVQWNFPNTHYTQASYTLKGKDPNVIEPYFVKRSLFQNSCGFWAQFNAGIGFLYFNGVRGNLMGKPTINFPVSQYRDAPIKGRMSYNRTPLFEYLFGYRTHMWLNWALSYQHQAFVDFSTPATYGFPSPRITSYVTFRSTLALDAVYLKVYFEAPWALIMKRLSFTPYAAVAIGPGWQSWTSNQCYYSTDNDGFVQDAVFYRQKISANCVFSIDKGFRIQSAYPNSPFGVTVGVKYNYWGQARNLGKMSQQGNKKIALSQPLRIKHVHQFAPYLGVQWNF